MTIFNFNNCFLIELYRQTKHNTMGWGHKTVYKNEFLPCNVIHYSFDCIIVYMQNHDHIDKHTIYPHRSK
jgi:hypothetical protein